MEGDHIAYIILRDAPFQTNGLQYVKLNLDTPSIVVHKRITKNDFNSEVISLVTGETPITALFLTGWYTYSTAGKAYRSIWVWKADSELLNPSVSFEYTWTEAGWTALINNGADESAEIFPEHMAYETGYIYVGASLYKSTAFVSTTTPVLLFYLSSSSLNLETTDQNFYFLRITNQQLSLRGYNIVESGVMSVFV